MRMRPVLMPRVQTSKRPAGLTPPMGGRHTGALVSVQRTLFLHSIIDFIGIGRLRYYYSTDSAHGQGVSPPMVCRKGSTCAC